MAQVATLGDVAFEVSAQLTKTIKDLSRESTPRWAAHEIIGRKPLLEFVGPGAESISFTIQLYEALGVKPEPELEKLRKMRDEGETVLFVLAGKPVTENLFVIEKMSEKTLFADGKGTALAVEVSLTIKEYPLRDTEKEKEQGKEAK